MLNKPKRKTRILTVRSARYLTPNMVRVTFEGDDLAGLPMGIEGAHCKLGFPKASQDRVDFEAAYENGRPADKSYSVRTYTVRSFRPETLEMDIDFVAHGDEGPATLWAQSAAPGDFLAFMGPGPVKLTEFYADWYLVAADMSALPVAAATLEAMPKTARGVAIFEIHSEADRQEIDMPAGFEAHWLVLGDPHKPSAAQIDFIRDLTFPEGRIQTCIAGESGVIRILRQLVLKERGIDKADAYISGYWKIGLVEDQHQQAKREGVAG
jgi:NADPH-dependent ferric siderophore reductase